MSRLLWTDVNHFNIDNQWKYQKFTHVLLYKLHRIHVDVK